MVAKRQHFPLSGFNLNAHVVLALEGFLGDQESKYQRRERREAC